ncbi:hypothetical protein LTR85_007246 [Meristemomyces frigidus]|nr:hypothetical protein LTR85_007246 [Meristemomyces frigidus]
MSEIDEIRLLIEDGTYHAIACGMSGLRVLLAMGLRLEVLQFPTAALPDIDNYGANTDSPVEERYAEYVADKIRWSWVRNMKVLVAEHQRPELHERNEEMQKHFQGLRGQDAVVAMGKSLIQRKWKELLQSMRIYDGHLVVET